MKAPYIPHPAAIVNGEASEVFSCCTLSQQHAANLVASCVQVLELKAHEVKDMLNNLVQLQSVVAP